MNYTSITDIGLIREENQDYYAIEEQNGVFLAVICDGIGGGNAGSLASKLAVNSLVDNFKSQKNLKSLEEISAWFGDAITKANFAVYEKSQGNPAYQGMGTTMIVLVLFGKRGFAFNIGDSRLYLYGDNVLKSISHDQTFAYELYLRNRIKKEEIDTHPKRNILMNAVGIDRQIRYEVIEIDPGWDQILLSSDGLHGYVDHEDIQKTLALDNLEDRKNKLLSLAYEQGAKDNISLILIEGDSDE